MDNGLINFIKIPTIYGVFKVLYKDQKIIKLVFPKHEPKKIKLGKTPNTEDIFALKIQDELNKYLQGKSKIINLHFNIDKNATPFTKNAWKTILKIPYGKTISYKKLAQLTNKENAIRAVATACGKNNLPIIIPCHRVISSSGKIGGFSADIEWKELLLDLEKRN